MLKKIKLGMFGLGTVGSGLVNIIENRKEQLAEQYGIELELCKAVVRNPEKGRDCNTSTIQISTDHDEVLNDPTIDIVIELIGGTDDAYTICKRSLQGGRPVVTANKALVSEHGVELFLLAKKNRIPFFAEASVGGGIPILKTIRESLVGNDISSITAIINGTTNFILTKMEEDGLSYFEALKLAGDLGFAEADPTMDVEGIDAQQKLRILAAHISAGIFPEGEIICKGITELSDTDFRFAKNHKMTIKLLALARKRNGMLELRVHPTLISKYHPLASVRNEFNAVFLKGDAVGDIMLSGRGAGSLPTASAVYADIVDICIRTDKGDTVARSGDTPKILPADDIESEFYLRFTIEDKPGVIGDIATILGKHNISVITAAAELIPNAPDLGEVEIIIHLTREADLKAAMIDINQLSSIRGEGKFIHIEKGLR